MKSLDPEEYCYDLERFYITNGQAYLRVNYDDKIDNPMYDVKLEEEQFEYAIKLLGVIIE